MLNNSMTFKLGEPIGGVVRYEARIECRALGLHRDFHHHSQKPLIIHYWTQTSHYEGGYVLLYHAGRTGWCQVVLLSALFLFYSTCSLSRFNGQAE